MFLRHGLAFPEAIPIHFGSDQFLKHMGLILSKQTGKEIWIKSLSSLANLMLMWTKLKWLILPRKEGLKRYLLSILLTPLLAKVFFLACMVKKNTQKKIARYFFPLVYFFQPKYKTLLRWLAIKEFLWFISWSNCLLLKKAILTSLC